MAGTLVVDKIQLDIGNTFQVLGNTGSVILSANATSTAFAAGSAAAPSITASGDTNTGIFFPAADTIAFAEGGVEAMRIDSSANVGIGTSSQNSRLHIRQDQDGVTRAIIQNRNGSGTPISEVAFITGSFDFSDSRYAYIQSGGGSSQYLAFGTGNGTAPAERARIDTSGNFLIGATTRASLEKVSITHDGASQEGIILINTNTAAGTHTSIGFRRPSGTTVGTITTTLSATAFNTSSDYRLKKNIQPMQNALAKVAALKPVTYKWKVDDSDGEGFIAHELQEVVPSAVTGEKDAVDKDGKIMPQGIDTSFLVATLTAAIQEQQAMIEELKAKVAALEAK
jgi:Chaperone of endosialidase